MRPLQNEISWRHYKRKNCRLCHSENLEPVLELADTPPANGLLGADQLSDPVDLFPLRLYRCAECQHVQLLDIVNPELLFSHYPYVSGISPILVRHLETEAESTIRRLNLKPGAFVVEIGSNDGTMLGFFKRAGMRVLGIDPARNVAEAANARGIPTLPRFFSPELADEIVAEHGHASLVCANHCLAHIDHLSPILDGVRRLLTEDGKLLFEVGYLLDVFQKSLFDTIYHEHVDYHHVTPLIGFFRRHGMTLTHVERNNIQGGALRGFVGLGDLPAEETVGRLVELEAAAGLDKAETFLVFEQSIRAKGRDLTALLKELKSGNRSIAAYGAPAKATTLMYTFGLDRSVVDFVVDDNPLKQGMFTPGLRIPIESAEALYQRRPDYLLILAWNFAEPIMAMHRRYRTEGGHFIVPLPDLSIH